MKRESLTNAVIECMSPQARRSLSLQTSEEAMAKFTARSEKELQQQVSNLLRLRGIKFLNPAMCKKSPLPIGWPDFTVFIPGGRVIFMECKIEGGKLSKEQAEFYKWADENGFTWYLITTVREAIDCLEGAK